MAPGTVARRMGESVPTRDRGHAMPAPAVLEGRAPGQYPRVVSMEPVVHLATPLRCSDVALAGIDLDVARGEIVLLRGPNGAGKTTVLRVRAGLVPVVRARRSSSAMTCATTRAVRRRVSMLGHATGLFDDLTVADLT